ncbi:MAG: rhodanese-like domain-containing protein [Thiotrichales bacterium]|nr:MAG: rhodanese-like domain-containing protein [Thiotrichales bacterium]
MNTGKTTNRKYLLISTAFLLLAVIGAVFFYTEVKDTLQMIESEQQKSSEFSRLANSRYPVHDILMSDIVADWNNIVIIDVREPEEYSEGRLKGSLNYRLGELLNNELARRNMIEQSGNRKRVFYCHDGDRSTLAASRIESEFGGTNYTMDRGFRQIQENDEYRTYWEGSTDILPGGKDYERTPVVKGDDVTASTLIDLSLQYKPPVRTLKGKTIIHAPILLMSDAQINAFIATLGNEPVIALCNSKVSCFSTRIFRYRLEQNGLKLSGFIRVK